MKYPKLKVWIVQSYLLNTAHSYNTFHSSKKIGSLDSGSLNKQYLKAKYTLSEIEKKYLGIQKLTNN